MCFDIEKIEELEKIKNKICKIIIDEKDLLRRRYTLYIDEVGILENNHDIKVWMNNNRYIFSKYGKEDIDKIRI
jgi:hypothetical protein